MLLALAGVTGVGKTYFTNVISQELNFKKINTIRTREMRPHEVNGKTGIFMSDEELDKEIAKGNIIYDFHVYGNRYAYLKDEILSNEDRVFEMYYTMFEDWEEMVSDLKTIYIFPTDLEKTKEKLKDRMLSKEEEAYRISEMQKQYNTVVNNREILDKYDHIFYNDYTEQATKDLLNIVRKMQAEQGGNCINKED